MERWPRRRELTGRAYLETATRLLQRVRRSDPTFGLFEAADIQWWWRTPRPTDGLPQLFWFDASDGPVAAAVTTDWGEMVTLVPITMPEASAELALHVLGSGLEQARRLGLGPLQLEVDRADHVVQDVLQEQGFAPEGSGLVESWLAADRRPAVSVLPAGYRLMARTERRAHPHHLAARSGPTVEERLRQTSLYRADLDLVVLAQDETDAAYGLFWLDPVSATGLVEPLRTADSHQRRGLARHLLTAGIERLTAAGAERVKICFEADNLAARDLYLGLGFVPTRQTVVLSAGPLRQAGVSGP